MHNIGWIAANLAFPYLGPILVVKSIRMMISRKHAVLRKRLRLTYLFRDGQYALTSLAVSTVSLYELLEPDNLSGSGKALLVLLIILSFFSVIMVVLGLIHETDDPEVAVPPGSGVFNWTTISKWVETYRVGAGTLILVLPVSLVAYGVHVTVRTEPQPGASIADKPVAPARTAKGS